jgi:hypothetical protein
MFEERIMNVTRFNSTSVANNLSDRSLVLLRMLVPAYGLLGLILFLTPAWAAPRFAWKVSEFVAMTIGGWCLGNAWAALVLLRRPTLSYMASGLLYLGLFAVFETSVLLAFRDRLALGHWIGWLYLATLVLAAVAAVSWITDILRARPRFEVEGPIYGAFTFAFGLSFVLIVGFIGLYGLTAGPSARGLNAGIFPEIITPFTLRAFGAFYLSLALSAVLLLFVRGTYNGLQHALAGWGLLLFITLAALFNLDRFHFLDRPGQLLYLGTYLIVGAITGTYLWRHRDWLAQAR